MHLFDQRRGHPTPAATMSLHRSVARTANIAMKHGPRASPSPQISSLRTASLYTTSGANSSVSNGEGGDSSSTSYGNHEGHAPDEHQEVSKPTDSNLSAPHKRKTQAELDEQLRQKMAGTMGDGGEAGVELEGGKEKGMGRAVKDNMFRYI